jgi:hypothetical protein
MRSGMPIHYVVKADSRLAHVTAEGVVEGEDVWPVFRHLLGTLRLELPCGLRLDVRNLTVMNLAAV